jgi:hypothetical protein
MTTIVSGGGFEFSTESVGGVWRWTVQANNLQGVGQLYQIINIYTPYGFLVDTQIPIPGDVVTSMAQSITQFQQQLDPLLALVDPIQTSFSVTVTEGDPVTGVGSVSIQNSGAFGSFMTAIATPDSSWIQVSPNSIIGLGKNEQGSFNIAVSPSTLLYTSSPYSGIINLQDNRSTPTIIPISINVNVLPRPVISASPLTVNFSYALLTGTPSGAQTLEVQNSGPATSSLEFTLAKVYNRSDWLDIVPTTGGPLASGNSTLITLSIISSEVPQVSGVYTDTVRISSQNASNSPVDVSIILTVS